MLSIVKFLFVPFTMMFDRVEQYTWIEVVLTSTSGAALGCYIFFHGGEWIIEQSGKLFGKKQKRHFSSWKRRIIRIKWKFGLKGLMLISGLISVPFASILAAKFYRHVPGALPMMIIGFALWSLGLSTLAFALKALYYHL